MGVRQTEAGLGEKHQEVVAVFGVVQSRGVPLVTVQLYGPPSPRRGLTAHTILPTMMVGLH
jgi:lipoate synthase